MDFDELQQIQYKICMMATDDEKLDDCIFDAFWAISNLIKLMMQKKR